MSLSSFLFLDKSTVEENIHTQSVEKKRRLRLLGYFQERSLLFFLEGRRTEEILREEYREARHYHKNARNLEDLGFMSERRWLARDKFRRIGSNSPHADKGTPV